MKYKEINIKYDYNTNKEIFDSIKIGERFYIVTNDKNGNGLYKYLFIKTEERNKNSFLHKNTFISCYNIACDICNNSKCLGGRPIKIE